MVSTKQQPERNMTRKEALNVLIDLNTAYVDHLSYEEYMKQQAFCRQVIEAVVILTNAIYGPRHWSQLSFPCEICRHRRAEYYARKKERPSYDTIQCCSPCRERLQAEGKLEEEEEVLP